MSLSAVVVLVVLFLVAAYAVILYNGLVRLKHGVGKAWANIDVLLRQRHEELPKLVETCRQYMQHERNTLEQVISARNAVSSAREQGDVSALGQAETGLRAGLGRLFALAENYPELKANQAFRDLRVTLEGTENRIAVARDRYIGTVKAYNIKARQFPTNLTAKVFGYQPKANFTVQNEAQISQPPTVDFSSERK